MFVGKTHNILNSIELSIFADLRDYFGMSAPVIVNYTSNEADPTVIGTASFNINLSDSLDYLTVSAGYNDIANKITTGLQAIIDDRGTKATNTNYGNHALSSAVCYYTPPDFSIGTSAYFAISGVDAPCYVQNFYTSDVYNNICFNLLLSDSSETFITRKITVKIDTDC